MFLTNETLVVLESFSYLLIIFGTRASGWDGKIQAQDGCTKVFDYFTKTQPDTVL